MSPEQVRGQTADHRTDLFALGAVLYEMLSGQRAFRRDTTVDTMTAILKEDPPDLSDKRIPPALVRVVYRCLEKSAARRFQSAVDLAFALEELAFPSEGRSIDTEAVTPRRGSRAAWSVATVLGVATLATTALAATLYFNRAPAEAPTFRYSIAPPDDWRLSLATRPGAPTPIVVAPDGRSVALVVRRADGLDMIWIQPLDALAPRLLPGTEGASSVFWSPDSRNLGFLANGKLKRVEVAAGPPTIVCDAPVASGGTWSNDGVIVFYDGLSKLKKVTASGGTPTDAIPPGTSERAFYRPWLLPDGRHVIYTGYIQGQIGKVAIYVGLLNSSDRARIGESSSTNVMFSQGHLLFMRDTALMAQPFDAKRLVTNGDAFPVAAGIQSQGAEPHQGVFSVSQNGVLVYQSGRAAVTSQLAWVTRTGTRLSTVSDPATYTGVTLSPDEKRAIVSISMADLWMIDLARNGLRTRFTFDQSVLFSALWSPDRERITYTVAGARIVQKPSNGPGAETLLLGSVEGQTRVPTDWSTDGRQLLIAVGTPGRSGSEVWVLGSGDSEAHAFLTMPNANETAARFSPDGRWVAYVSDESGRNEVYVVPFAAPQVGSAPVSPQGKWQVSTGGGTLPRWRRDGKEIFYFDETNSRMMAALVNGRDSAFEVGLAQVLFPIRPSGGITTGGPVQRIFYDVSRDGQRFLVNAEPGASATAAPPATVVVNWVPVPRK
jgi:Tol biopolymer transport system component